MGIKIKRRKRQVLVDTLGFVGQQCNATNLPDMIIDCVLFDNIKHKLQRLEKILLNAKNKGTFIEEATSKPPGTKGFVPITKRWVSECTLGWFNFFEDIQKTMNILQNALNL